MPGYVALLMLTDKLEDIAVEALGYILSNSEYARLALTEFVGDGGITIDDINRVQTQDVGETLERPDIAFRNTQGEKHLSRQPILPARCLKVFVTERKLLPHGECYPNQVVASQ